MLKSLRYQHGEAPYFRTVENVNEVTLVISEQWSLRIKHNERDHETLVLLDRQEPNPEGPHPTKTVTECIASILHAS